MVMIRSGDNRQGVCPVKFLQEVWHRSEVACQATYPCNCLDKQQNAPPSTLKKIYYPSPTPRFIQNNTMTKQNNKKNINSGSILQYYYNNFGQNNKDTNVYNNVLNRRRNELAFLHGKAPFSSTKRPLSIRLSTPKHVANFFSKSFKSDSQKRPLLLQGTMGFNNQDNKPNFQIVPNRNGLRLSSIYTISEDVEKFSLYRKNLYISSNSRPLFVRKWEIFYCTIPQKIRRNSSTYFYKCYSNYLYLHVIYQHVLSHLESTNSLHTILTTEKIDVNHG